MKIRTDFVTNSSSASFILARKGEISDAQKIALADAFLDTLLGETVLTRENSEEEVQEFLEDNWVRENQSRMVRNAIEEGKEIRCGHVCFQDDGPICTLRRFYQTAWKILWRTPEPVPLTALTPRCTTENPAL